MVSFPPIIPPEQRRYTLTEYLNLEQQGEAKIELHQGIIRIMPGGTAIHNELSANIIFALKSALKSLEETYKLYNSDMRIQIPEFDAYVYPDAVVVCKKPEFISGRNDIIINPLLVVEVLSPSTEGYDRELKFIKYASLPSFKEYVLVHTNKPLITTMFRKSTDTWQSKNYLPTDAKVELRSIGTSINWEDVYGGVDLG